MEKLARAASNSAVRREESSSSTEHVLQDPMARQREVMGVNGEITNRSDDSKLLSLQRSRMTLNRETWT